jgi:TonB family protein
MAMFRNCFVGQFAVLTLLVAIAEGQASSKPSDAVAQQARTVMPTVASVPLYPRVIRAARIQGDVVLRVSTDGRRVFAVELKSGPPMLAEAAKDSVKTWQFEPHTPTSFEVTFHYKLLLPTKCDSECNCDSEEKESMLLQLPTNVDVSAKVPSICDPREKVESKR